MPAWREKRSRNWSSVTTSAGGSVGWRDEEVLVNDACSWARTACVTYLGEGEGEGEGER